MSKFNLVNFILLFFLLLFPNIPAFAQDDILTTELGLATVQNDKYLISLIITPDNISTVTKWLTAKETPMIKTTNKIKLNQEVGLLLTVSPKNDIDKANITYDVMLKLPDSRVTAPTSFILAQSSLEKNVIHFMQKEMYGIVANAPSDCGDYQFIVDIFDNGKKIKRVVMEFKIVA